MSTSHTWDQNGRETLLQNLNAAGAGLAIFTNTFSPVDTRLTTQELDATLVTNLFDSTKQLTYEARSGTYAYARSYVYDPNGNRVQQFDSGALTQRSFNAASAQILMTPPSGAPTTQTFDAIGNLLTSATGSALTTNTWSAENAMLSTVSPAENEQYLYGQDGLRRQKTNASGTTSFTLDGLNVLLETSAAGVLQARNTQEPGGVGGLISQNRSSASSFYGFDTQQSTRILVSTGGLVTDSYAFRAFGEELETGSGTPNPFWYIGNQGYYRDFVNWMNVGRRRLDAANGRWPNRDLIGFAGGQANLYGYVGNEPVGRVDASGLKISVTPYNSGDYTWRVGKSDGAKSCCGAYRAFWTFSMDPKPPCTINPGYYVQLVTLSLTITNNCDPKANKNAKTVPPLTYLEVWTDTAADGKVDWIDGVDYSDQFGLLVAQYKTVGKYSASGEVRYFCASELPDFNPPSEQLTRLGFGRSGDCADHSGILPCMDLKGGASPPSWWNTLDRSGGPGKHWGAGHWDCCCKDPAQYSSTTNAAPATGVTIPTNPPCP